MKWPSHLETQFKQITKLDSKKSLYQNVELIHKARIASRYMRSLIHMALLANPDAAALVKTTKQLKKLTNYLGNIREYDVLTKLIIKHFQKSFPETSKKVLKQAKKKKVKVCERIGNKINKLATKKSKLWHQQLSDLDEPSLISGINRCLLQYQVTTNNIYQAYQENPNITLLHEYRIAIKKWRYATEIANTFNINTAITVESLKSLQGDLGKLTDYEGILITLNKLGLKKRKIKKLRKKLKADIRILEELALAHVSKPVAKVIKHYPLRLKNHDTILAEPAPTQDNNISSEQAV